MKGLRVSRGEVFALLLVVLAAGSNGCARTARTETGFVDRHPLPPDTLTVQTAAIGSYGGRFVIGETTGPKTFNAIMANETSSNDICARMFVGLSDFNNAEQTDTPAIAKSWELAGDSLTWTFQLRRGAAFSDGHPISSADVLFSFEVAFDPVLHPSVQDLLIMGGKRVEVSAPDSYTVVLKTPKPFAILLGAASSVPILPKHILEGALRSGNFASAYNVSTPPESIVTSGPWCLKTHVANEKTVLTRNPYWYGVDTQGHRLPYLDELVFLVVPNQDALDLKFRSGEVDAMDNPKPENYAWYTEHQKADNFTLFDLGPRMSTNFFFFNLNKVRKPVKGKKLGQIYTTPEKYALFNNMKFRRAVSMAIDREAMITSLFFGHGVKNWSQMTAGNKRWYSTDTPHFDRDTVQARQLLAEIGLKDRNGDGFLDNAQGHTVGFSIKTNGDNLLRVGMGNFIKDDLAKVGIKVTLVPVDFNTLVTNSRENFDYDAILIGLESATPPDPGMGANVWRSTGKTHYWNMTQPKPETREEAQIDALMDVISTPIAFERRKDAWRQIEAIVNEQCWIEWLPTLILEIPASNRFGNLQPTVIPHRLLWNIDRVFVKARAGIA